MFASEREMHDEQGGLRSEDSQGEWEGDPKY